MKNLKLTLRLVMVFALWLVTSGVAQAQWLTQTIKLKAGWNGVYLHVDPSYETIDKLVGAGAIIVTPIQEVWLWKPNPATMQFVQTPQQPLDTGTQWASWKRSENETSQRLQKMIGNAAYLVYSTTDYTWELKGKPLLPGLDWTVSGLNFIGFPTAAETPPTFEDFLSQSPPLLQYGEFFRYTGGELGANNPSKVLALRTTKVQRGQAFWARSGTHYNRYFGPVEVTSSSGNGVSFGDKLSTVSLRLKNHTSGNLVITLKLTASETPPTDQTAIVGAPPLLVRGEINITNLTYGYTTLTLAQPITYTLAAKGLPGSEREVVLGLNRSVITATPGSLLAGVLSVTDSLGHSKIDMPVSATPASSKGLWVGSAMATQVGQYLKTYEKDSNGKPVTTAEGKYNVTATDTTLGAVPRFFPLRLIVHNPETSDGKAVLLQRVYVGLDAFTNQVVSCTESALGSSFLASARRVSAAHLPWSKANTGWSFDAKLGLTSTINATVTDDYNDHASNPFLHTYHPDHDNRDTAFANYLTQGSESYTVERSIRLQVKPPTDDFASLTTATKTLGGEYVETIKLLGLARAGGVNDSRQFEVRGAFSLNRITDVSTLTVTP